jgi:membrane protein YdbS with pleckstrin-like domain
MVETVARLVTVAGISAALLVWVDNRSALIAISAVAGFVGMGILADLILLNRLSYRNYSYTVTPDYVYIAQGRFVRRSVTIDNGKVLNVQTSQGPILRRFGLVTLRLTCIVETERLGPVAVESVEEIRRIILDEQ